MSPLDRFFDSPRRIALDFNILNALLRAEVQVSRVAALLGGLREVYTLTVCPVVHAELLRLLMPF